MFMVLSLWQSDYESSRGEHRRRLKQLLTYGPS